MHHAFIDNYAKLRSPLQALNPRLKVILWVVFLLLIIFAPAWRVISFYAVAVSLLLLLSRVPLAFILKRLLEIAPFALVIALSALFGKGGWKAFLFYTARAVLAVLLTLIVFSTTRFAQLLEALRQLRVPELCVNVLSFMYRYSFLLEDQMLRARRAYDSRNTGAKFDFRKLAALGNILGALFIRSYERAERIYLAMCARGYRNG